MTSADPSVPLAPREVANALRAALLAVRVECTGLPATDPLVDYSQIRVDIRLFDVDAFKSLTCEWK